MFFQDQKNSKLAGKDKVDINVLGRLLVGGQKCKGAA